MEIRNAIIRKAYFDTERGLSAWLDLDYGGMCQGFGGFVLYVPQSWDSYRPDQRNYTGHFIYRCLEVAGVNDWSQLAGKSIRVRKEDGLNGLALAIGHIIKDDWFEPRVDFKAMETGARTEGGTTHGT